MNCQIAKKHSAQKSDVAFKCKFCHEEFPGFHAIRQRRKNQPGFPIKSADVELNDFINNMNHMDLKGELRSCQQFPVVSQLERARHNTLNFAIENLNATKMNEKLDHFFNILRSAVKVNLAFGFILKNTKDGKFK